MVYTEPGPKHLNEFGTYNVKGSGVPPTKRDMNAADQARVGRAAYMTNDVRISWYNPATKLKESLDYDGDGEAELADISNYGKYVVIGVGDTIIQAFKLYQMGGWFERNLYIFGGRGLIVYLLVNQDPLINGGILYNASFQHRITRGTMHEIHREVTSWSQVALSQTPPLLPQHTDRESQR